jgi:hypothetical protein
MLRNAKIKKVIHDLWGAKAVKLVDAITEGLSDQIKSSSSLPDVEEILASDISEERKVSELRPILQELVDRFPKGDPMYNHFCNLIEDSIKPLDGASLRRVVRSIERNQKTPMGVVNQILGRGNNAKSK